MREEIVKVDRQMSPRFTSYVIRQRKMTSRKLDGKNFGR
jgi:hypothetical protein